MKNAESVYMYLTTRFTGDFLMCCTNDYLGRPSNNGQVMQIALMTDIRFQVKLPYRVTCVVTKLVTEPTASNEQVMEQVMEQVTSPCSHPGGR